MCLADLLSLHRPMRIPRAGCAESATPLNGLSLSNKTTMDDLKEIYERIKYLRHKGVKMKEIATHTGFTPSVLSALFTTVLPEYIKNIDNGQTEDEALDNALTWVNNVSKKKLLNSIGKTKTLLFSMEAAPRQAAADSGNEFLDAIGREMKAAVQLAAGLSGAYMSYSVSSSSGAMKVEPYLIVSSDDGSYVEVVHNNAYGSTHHGFALMNGLTHLYIMFNENRSPQIALFNICLKIPMFDRPPFLRGLYTCFDYNHNPIARRILFVKTSDSVSRDEFMKMKDCLKQYDELGDEERMYYEYTCGREDVVRMRDVPTPKMTVEDLVAEKEMLK